MPKIPKNEEKNLSFDATNEKLLQEKEEKDRFHIDVQEMMEAGVHLGHRTSRLNPRMDKYVLGIRNTVHVIDLDKTAECLKTALCFIEDLIKKGGNLLFVSTKTPLKELVKTTAKECDLPYIVERWLGGTFTNFEVISKRIQYFNDLKSQKEEGKLEKYTKKERIKIEKELADLGLNFGGLQKVEKLPEAVFICDVVKDALPLKESKMKKIKVVAIVDTNADPIPVDFPIPANDDAITSVRYILERVKEVILNSKTGKLK